MDEAAHARNEEIIVKKLAGFGIPARIVARNAGPVVTQYEVQPAPDVKVSRIEGLSDDLAMALAASSLRIEAPIPGKSAVGIEIPNKDFNAVPLRRVLEEVEFTASESKLTFALGRDVAGIAKAVDLAKMPHLLIAGATGSGKSVMVNAVITSLLCKATPDDVRMILMDLKRVELAAYNGLPHLLVPVITEPERAKAALKWAANEMEARYRRLAGASARNIRAFNETRVDPEDRMPYIVIIIDELADLMMREGKNVEDPIVRLAQKARATGHPHGACHAAAKRQRRDRPDQGQLPEPDRVCHGLADRLANDPRHTTLPIRASARWAISSSARSVRCARRRSISSAGRCPSSPAASVPSSSEYPNTPITSSSAAIRKSRNSSTSPSVSPGKPQITLLRIPAAGASDRIDASRLKKASGLPKRRIRRNTGADACWKDRSKYGTTPAVPAITSIRPGRISAGCR